MKKRTTKARKAPGRGVGDNEANGSGVQGTLGTHATKLMKVKAHLSNAMNGLVQDVMEDILEHAVDIAPQGMMHKAVRLVVCRNLHCINCLVGVLVGTKLLCPGRYGDFLEWL